MSDPGPSREQSQTVTLRGADIAPVKRRHMDYLAMLELEMFRRRHMIEFDYEAQVRVVDNIEGTLVAVLKGLISREREDAHAALNMWLSEWENTPNEDRPRFASHTLTDIFFDSRKAGLLDLREKPSPRRSSTAFTEAFVEEPAEVEG